MVNHRSKQRQVPSGWPEDVMYTQHINVDNNYADTCLRNHVKKLLSQHKQKRQGTNSTNVKIKCINDPAHPAYRQRGLFAAKRLEARSWILDYGGELLPDSNPQTDESDYCLKYVCSHSIDAWKMGNEARFINDFRGIPNVSKPNVEFSEFELNASSSGNEGGANEKVTILGFRVLHEPIKKGTELIASYGKGFWEKRGLFSENEYNCPGRHGLELFSIPQDGSSYLCYLCSALVDASNTQGFVFCKRCNYGICKVCRSA